MYEYKFRNARWNDFFVLVAKVDCSDIIELAKQVVRDNQYEDGALL